MTRKDITDTLDRFMTEDKDLKDALEKVCRALNAFSADEDGDEYTSSVISGITQVATRCVKGYLDNDKRFYKRNIGRDDER